MIHSSTRPNRETSTQRAKPETRKRKPLELLGKVLKVAGMNLFVLGVLVAGVEVFFAIVGEERRISPWERTYTLRLPPHAESIPRSVPRRAVRATLPPPRLAERPWIWTPGSDYSREFKEPFFVGPARLKPEYSAKSVVTAEGGRVVVWDVPVTTDSLGRRTSTFDPSANQHLIFFGCSFTFGNGVADQDTLPSRAAALAPRFRPYNYGIPGAGPAEMLAAAETRPLRKEIEQERGWAVYVLIADHIRRVTPSIFLSQHRGAARYYQEGPNGELSSAPSFREGDPVRFTAFDLLAKSRTLAHYRLDYPYFYGEEEVRWLARMLQGLQSEYERAFKSRNFLVLIYPGAVALAPVLIDYLEHFGIQYIDYSRLDPLRHVERPYHLPHDVHPTAQLNALVAELLVNDMGWR